ncbi:hypothetical protein GCM10007086_26680 [Photobacterium aphoticum]|uniref:Uncharacterized protein n=1 Tax=Photobacterium aphoticum TaxID=754436 RepID=A0A0J1JG71_9GAMM|nr:hypothetical protein ABT58_11350 [Photobacterium aphoticum]PSU54639.1 hypothetical protein C9I90_19665 [Photobacterium aphoticum]GHA51353.1 hypothetical protein GCM10007086_26680 [Photobacterium aphoticum]
MFLTEKLTKLTWVKAGNSPSGFVIRCFFAEARKGSGNRVASHNFDGIYGVNVGELALNDPKINSKAGGKCEGLYRRLQRRMNKNAAFLT